MSLEQVSKSLGSIKNISQGSGRWAPRPCMSKSTLCWLIRKTQRNIWLKWSKQEQQDLGRFRHSLICQGTSTRRQRSDLFGLRVKLPPPATTSLTTLR